MDPISELRDNLSRTSLKEKTFESEFLIPFLHSRDLDIEKSTDLILNYVNTKRKYPNVFRPLPELRKVFETNSMGFLDTVMPSGHRIIVVRVGESWDPSLVSFDTMFAAIISCFEYRIVTDELFQSDGCIQVIDTSNMGWKQFNTRLPVWKFWGISHFARS